MDFRCVIITVLSVLLFTTDGKSTHKESDVENTTHNCPFTKIIEDIFKFKNQTSISAVGDNGANFTRDFLYNNHNISKSIQDELVNGIIASIKRIKANLTRTENQSLNEAIILNVPHHNKSSIKKVNQIKSGMDDKVDILLAAPKEKNSNPNSDLDKSEIKESQNGKYVEILTIEPNNTTANNSTSHTILEVLKNIMPKLNSSMNKDLHSITIIEKNQNKNHSYTETKNISTIIVKYCDKENFTEANSEEVKEGALKSVSSGSNEDEVDDYDTDDDIDYGEWESDANINTTEPRKDVLEAAEYGIQKMHELYGVLEPMLYSMGLMLNEKDPARYVAAFNAPSEDMSRYSQYGYASLQATAKLKQLLRENGENLESRTEDSQFPGASALRQSSLLEQCPLRGPPKCPPASKRYRTHDGTCNNLHRPRWGATITPVQRFIPPVYSDSIQAPRKSIFGVTLPSAREVSALIHEDKHAENTGVTHLLMQWGQFIDHDITSSSQSRGFNGSVPRCCKEGGRDFMPREFMHPECMPIAVPSSDPFYGPRGVRCLEFVRSSPAPHDDCALGWREQFNQVSAYIDGSPVYSSSARQSDRLRLFRNGLLQYGRPPREELCLGGALSATCFHSGDARVNEHPGLVAAHVVWLKQHNRMAQELSHLNPHWSDEKIYQETRKIVGAMIQHISYREFLPIVLGSEVMRLFDLEVQQKGYYRGYDPKINASPASSFGSAAFRFGHSLVQPSMVRFDRFHRPINNNVSLHDELLNPSNIWSVGALDRLLLGMVNQPIQKRDEYITEELTNHLFQTPQVPFGMDLAAINIQRGRDHGVPPYTMWREPCGLTEIDGFDDLMRIMPARVVRKLRVLYRHVDDIDLFTGGMAERPVVGGLVGPTFACVIAQQFSNLRKGDRFWYENGGLESSFTPAQLQQIRRISLAQVLCKALDTVDNVQPFAFLSHQNIDNERISCRNILLNNFDLSPWIEINSDSNKRKSENNLLRTTPKPKRKSTTPKSLTTRKSVKNQAEDRIDNPIQKLNTTDSTDATDTDGDLNKTDTIKTPLLTIDDKLDFKNKTRRFSNIDSPYNPTRQYSDYYDEVQSVQSVVINNLQNKRPSRPYISVTENIDKYTYLINYVPRSTQSWRKTTKRNYDRDVVKVTYQNYDDTYRRPIRPYYNRDEDLESRDSRPVVRTTESSNSARSNDDISPDLKISTETLITTDRQTVTDKTNDTNIDATTENMYKLLTFGYVGTYRGNTTINNEQNKNDFTTKLTSTIKTDITDEPSTKLSTFLIYETATKPYALHRPTRRNDEQTETKDKYYFIHNVLKKYPEKHKINETGKSEVLQNNHSNETDIYNFGIEERSGNKKISSELKTVNRVRVKQRPSSVKTPSVAFDVIPSENNASQWAVYDEKEDLIVNLPKMPKISADPYALRELPRPLEFPRRRPGKT